MIDKSIIYPHHGMLFWNQKKMKPKNIILSENKPDIRDHSINMEVQKNLLSGKIESKIGVSWGGYEA